MNLKTIIGILLLVTSLKVAPSESCSMGKSKSYQLYSKLNLDNKTPTAKDFVPTCSNYNKSKYLMIRIGLKNLNFDGRSTTNYYENIAPSKTKCKIKNINENNLVMNDEQFLKLMSSRKNTIEECLLGKITSDNKTKLEYPENQNYCTIERIDEKSANFKGSRCLFERKPWSNFQINYETNPKCADLDFAKNEKLIFGDLDIDLLYSFTDSAKEDEVFLSSNIIGTSKINYTLIPPEFIFPLAENDYGQFKTSPSNWIMPDQYLGGVKIKKIGDFVNIETPIFVSNVCQDFCEGGLCASECNFNTPFTAIMEIFHIKKNGQKEFINEWRRLGVIPGQWQGIIPEIPISMEDFDNYFKEGEKFKIVMSFGDPRYDYLMAKKSLISKFKIGNLHLTIPEFKLGTAMPSLPEIILRPIVSDESTIPSFGDLGNKSVSEYLASILERIFGKNDQEWPSKYENICGNDYKTCKKTMDNHTRIILDFSLISENHNDQNPEVINFDLGTIRVKKESFIQGNYEWNKRAEDFPTLDCE